MERLDGIGGVFLYADDAAKLAGWYREVLGVPLEFNAEEKNNWYTVYPARDGEGKEFFVVFSIFQAEKPLGEGRGQARVNWRVRDLGAMLAQLRERGVEVVRTQAYSYGTFAWVNDPEGNSVEMWEAKQ